VVNRTLEHNLTCKAKEKIRLVTVLKIQNWFPQMKTSQKVHVCLHCIFIRAENVLPCKAMLVR